jgi:hypothetical protein
VLNSKEMELLQKGLKYNLHYDPKNWVQKSAMEAEAAVSLLPALDQDPIRYQTAHNIKHYYTSNTKNITTPPRKHLMRKKYLINQKENFPKIMLS